LRLAVALAVALAVGACSPSPSSGTGVVAPGDGLRPQGPTERAQVIRVVDGDTIVVDRGQGRERVRYIGIDAPESVAPDVPVEPFGEAASKANAALVDGREVVLERDVSDVDRFGRLLRYVWLDDGGTWRLVNLELVEQGFANAGTYRPDVRWQDVLREAEREAREAGRGLWGG
jgi:micrococcal nuclease